MSDIICPHCLSKIKGISSDTNKAKRKMLILDLLKKETTGNDLYKSCRTHGYPMKRKTFQRDLQELAVRKKIQMEITIGGYDGSKSIVSPVRGDA